MATRRDSSLHAYDLQLCRYVCDSVRRHLPKGLTLDGLTAIRAALSARQGQDHRAGHRWYYDLPPAEAFAHLFAERVKPEPLQDFVLKADDVAMLLSDAELETLVLALGDVEPVLDRWWEPQLWVHRAYRRCVREVRDFASTEVEPFALASSDFAEQLTRDRLPLHAGIDIVRSWVGAIRDLLDDIGRHDVLPRPRGTFATPTSAGHISFDDLPPSVQDAVANLQDHFEKNHGLANCKADDVYRAVGGRRGSFLEALRWLELVGRYRGRRRRTRTP